MLVFAAVLALGGGANPEPPARLLISTVDRSVPQPVAESLVERAGAAFEGHGWATDGRPGVCAGDATAACRAQAIEGRRGLLLDVSQEASDYTITIGALDDHGALVGEVSHRCRICRQSELAEAVTTAVDAFVAAAPGSVHVVSAPSGATVWVDGEAVGQTPIDVELPAGPHQVSVQAPDHHDAQESVEVEHGGLHRVSFSLQETSAGVSPRTEEVLGWAGVAAGIAGVAAGVVLTVLDERELGGQCSGNDVDVDGDCRYLHDTLVPGVVLIGAGAAVGVAGGILVWHGRRRGRGPRSQAWLVPTGVRGRF